MRVEMLGGVRVLLNGHEVGELASMRTSLALLVTLCLLGESDREAIIALLWPDSPPDRARHTLSQTLYKLRGNLGSDWIRRRGDRLILGADVQTDVQEFTACADGGDAEGALRRYGGPLLGAAPLGISNAFEVWVDTHRARLARVHKQLLRGYVEACVAQGRYDDAIHAATSAVTTDPTDDEAQHRLIEALAASGDTLAALAQFERYRAALEPDDLEPLEQTVELIENIRSRVAVPEVSLPAPPAAVPRPGPDSSALPAVPRRRGMRQALALTLIVVAAGAAVWWQATRPAALELPTTQLIRIHVDEFRDLTGGAAGVQGTLLADRVADRLATVGRFAVLGTTGLRLLRERGIPTGDTLTTVPDFVVAGSLERQDSTWSLSVRLVDPVTERVLDSTRETVHLNAGGVARDRIVDRATEFLRRSVGLHYGARAEAGGRGPPRARALAEQASAQLRMAERLSRAGRFPAAGAALEVADSLLILAEQLAPAWSRLPAARAELALSSATFRLSAAGFAGRDSARALVTRSVEHAARALTLDGDDVDALESRGLALYRLSVMVAPDSAERLRQRAEQDLGEAVRRDPARTGAYRVLSELYWRNAAFPDAFVMARRAWETDAFLVNAAPNAYRIGMAYFELGADDDARTWCEDGRARDPLHPQFRYCLLHLLAFTSVPATAADVGAAIAAADSATHPDQRPLMGARHRLLGAIALLRIGEHAQARTLFAEASRGNVTDPGRLWLDAAWFDRAGETDSAAARLRGFVAADPGGARPILQSRVFRALREGGAYPDLFASATTAAPSR